MTICLNTQTLNTHQPSHKQLSQPVTTHITAHESYDYVQFTNLVWTLTHKLNSRFLELMHIIYIRALCSVHHKNPAQSSWLSRAGSCDTGADCYYQVRKLSTGLRALPANLCLMCTSNWERPRGFHADTVLPLSGIISFYCHDKSVTESVMAGRCSGLDRTESPTFSKPFLSTAHFC